MTPSSRRSLLQAAALATTAAALPPLVTRVARAAGPVAGAQVPGLYRHKVGDAEVTFVLDGGLQIPLGMFPKAPPAEAEAVLASQFQGPGNTTAHVVAWLVNAGGKTTLVDTGGQGLAPTLGLLAKNLAAAGIDAGAIDTVVLTHMHADHVNGLLAGPGKAAFPNAELVVAEAELAFWTKAAADPATPADFKPFVDAAVNAVAPYKERTRTFNGDVEVAPSLTAVALPGHTPGHTGYRVAGGDQQLLIWGDIVHSQAMQFTHPEWAIAFDVDQDAAIVTRKKVLDMVATDRIPVAGAHLLFPGTGRVAKSGTTYAYVPTPFSPSL